MIGGGVIWLVVQDGHRGGGASGFHAQMSSYEICHIYRFAGLQAVAFLARQARRSRYDPFNDLLLFC